MDLPVLLLKFRDYLFWLGPFYLLAVALDSATALCVRRLLHLPQLAERKTTELRQASATLGIASTLDSEGIVLQVVWHMAGRPSGAWRVSTRLYVWSTLVSRSVCWTSLLLTSLLGLPLSLMRLGFGVFMASLLSLLTPLLIDRSGGMGVMIVPVRADPEEGASRPAVIREWWHSVQTRFEATADILLLGAGLGAAFIAISPSLTAFLRGSLVTPVSQVIGTAIGLLLPLLPGTELPLLVAMQSRGIEGGALSALLLVVTVSNWRLARDLYYQLSLRAAIAYMAMAGLIALLLSFLAGLLFSFIGAL